MTGPLASLRVIDLSTVMMGPYLTQIMAAFGATVIKVESPEGDPVREIGSVPRIDMGPLFIQANHGKKSLVLDLKTSDGREALLKLTEGSDVLVTNLRPKSIQTLGLGYDVLSARNPRLVYASLLGFGRGGPYEGRPAYDDLIQGAAGIPHLFKVAGSDEPRYVPLTLADRVVGLYALNSILAALWSREHSNKGQHIDIAMFETMASLVLADHMGGAVLDPPSGPLGYARLLSKGRKPYQTLDGYVCATMITDSQWRRFFSAFGRDDLLEHDPRFSTMTERLRRADEINELVAKSIARHTTAECVALLGSVDIPVTPMNTIEQLLRDPHLAAVDFFEAIEHPGGGLLRMPKTPARFSGTPTATLRTAPRLGEHSREILLSLGYGEADIDAMIRAKITT